MNKLYKIWQDIYDIYYDYDMYDSAIVCAENEEEARNTKFDDIDSWVKPEDVHVEEIGIAKDNIKKGIILASFNAG